MKHQHSYANHKNYGALYTMSTVNTHFNYSMNLCYEFDFTNDVQQDPSERYRFNPHYTPTYYVDFGVAFLEFFPLHRNW